MYQFLQKHRLLLASLVVLCLLAGCSSTGSESSTPSPTPAIEQSAEATPQPSPENNDTRMFSTINGDIEIPVNPQRIVTQGLLPYLLAFDVKPVGAPEWEIEYPHLAGKTDGIVDIGYIDGSSLEKIVELEPDLIVTVAAEMYDQLSKIAPTVVIPYDAIGDAHNDMRLFGELLGKQEEAEQWLETFDQKVAESKEKISDVVGPDDTFSIVSAFDKTYYMYGEGVYRGGLAIYKYLELQPSPLVKQDLIDAKKPLVEISFEVIADYAGNHIFLDVSNGGKLDESTNMWKSLEAVKNNQVYRLDVDIFWPYDPIAIMMQMDEIIKMLEA